VEQDRDPAAGKPRRFGQAEALLELHRRHRPGGFLPRHRVGDPHPGAAGDVNPFRRQLIEPCRLGPGQEIPQRPRKVQAADGGAGGKGLQFRTQPLIEA
jgi:hypothetical protein